MFMQALAALPAGSEARQQATRAGQRIRMVPVRVVVVVVIDAHGDRVPAGHRSWGCC